MCSMELAMRCSACLNRALLWSKISCPKRARTADRRSMEELERRNTLLCAPGKNNLRKIPSSQLKISFEFADLSFLPPELQIETWTRYTIIQPLVKRPRPRRTREDVKKRIHDFFDNLRNKMKNSLWPLASALEWGKRIL